MMIPKSLMRIQLVSFIPSPNYLLQPFCIQLRSTVISKKPDILLQLILVSFIDFLVAWVCWANHTSLCEASVSSKLSFYIATCLLRPPKFALQSNTRFANSVTSALRNQNSGFLSSSLPANFRIFATDLVSLCEANRVFASFHFHP